MAKTLILAAAILCFGSARCEADAFAPLPQAFPVDSSNAFPVLQRQQQQQQQQQQGLLSTVPNFCNVKGSVAVGGKCLLVEQTPLSWHESRQYCSQIGFQLLEIVGGEQYFNLIDYLRERGLLLNSYWIGASRQFHGIWTWVSKGLPVHSTFWAVTFVNGKGVKEPITGYHNKDCAVLSKNRAHFIKAEQCSVRNCFICEKPFQQSLPTYPVDNPWFPLPHYLEGEDDHVESQCPSEWKLSKKEDKCFLVITGASTSFGEANDNCKSVNATLAIISNKEENYNLQNISDTDSGKVYIGLYSNTEGTFAWIDGTEVTFTNWASGQPEVKNMACGSFDLETGKWSDNSCQNKQGYICEREAY